MTRWLSEWPTAHPRLTGPWTVRHGDQWGVLDPERGRVDAVDPSTDRRLPGLPMALKSGRLVGYRHGRRAIVAAPATFIKVVRPSRVDALVDRHELLGGAGVPFEVPTVLDATTDGCVELSTVAGRSLHQTLRTEPMRSLDGIGAPVAALHAQPVPNQLQARGADKPEWLVATSRRAPTTHLPAIERTARDLPSLDQRAEVVVHGDLHDKNVFCDTPRPADAAQLTATPLLADAAPLGGAGPLALIDLDGLGLGAPEDDVANLAVHLELRNLQARTGLPFGTRSGELYRSYQRTQPLDRERLEAVERHTWFRLACLYQYRVASRHLVPQLLRAARGDSGQRDGDLTATEGTLADVK